MKLNRYVKTSLITLSVSLFSNTNLYCAAAGRTDPLRASFEKLTKDEVDALLKEKHGKLVAFLNSGQGSTNPLMQPIIGYARSQKDSREEDESRQALNLLLGQPENKQFINALDPATGFAPLHLAGALDNGDGSLVQLLLSKKANVNLSDKDGVQPLEYTDSLACGHKKR